MKKVGVEDLDQALASGNVRVKSTVLAQAILLKDLDAMKRLMDSGATLTCELADGSTALEVVIREDAQVVNQFFKPRCDAQTWALWQADLKAFNELTGRKPTPVTRYNPLLAAAYTAPKTRPPEPKPVPVADPPAEEKSPSCTML